MSKWGAQVSINAANAAMEEDKAVLMKAAIDVSEKLVSEKLNNFGKRKILLLTE